MSINEVVDQILTLGRGTELAKIDIESAFRNIPVHPHDRHLLGMSWNNQLFMDTVLPFVLRSAPKIFNCVADALQWIARSRGVSYIDHYLDDFITCGAPNTQQCHQNLSILMGLCDQLNMPLALEKLDGPTPCLVFLGILIDSSKLELRLPPEKLRRLLGMLSHWKAYKHCCKRDLESLIGYLQDASKVIHAGRTFTRRLIDLLKANHHRANTSHICLNVQAQSDIMWWHAFIQQWNGLSMMTNSRKQDPDIYIHSDASGSWGCGAFWGRYWFQFQWSQLSISFSITVKELLPIVIAAAIWGHMWVGKAVRCLCDNEAVVHIINSGMSKDPLVMKVMRCLHFISAKFNLLLSASHLAGINNTLADALSRNNLPLFFHCCPQADPHPSQLPQPLLELLIHSHLDWISPSWTSTFNSIFSQQSPRVPCAPTHQASSDTSVSALNTSSRLSPQVRTHSASSCPSSESSPLSTKPSSATFPVSVSTSSPIPMLTPSLTISPSSSMCYAASKFKRAS